MVLGLAPPGVPIGRSRTLAGRALAHLAGLGLGAGIVAIPLGLAGWALAEVMPTTQMLLIAAVLAAAFGLRDLGLPGIPFFRSTRQLPRRLLDSLPPRWAYFLSGVLLGTGLLTVSPYASFTAVLLFELLVGSVSGAMVVGMAYAFGRWIALLWGSWEASQAPRPTDYIPVALLRKARLQRLVGFAFVVGSALLARNVW